MVDAEPSASTMFPCLRDVGHHEAIRSAARSAMAYSVAYAAALVWADTTEGMTEASAAPVEKGLGVGLPVACDKLVKSSSAVLKLWLMSWPSL